MSRPETVATWSASVCALSIASAAFKSNSVWGNKADNVRPISGRRTPALGLQITVIAGPLHRRVMRRLRDRAALWAAAGRGSQVIAAVAAQTHLLPMFRTPQIHERHGEETQKRGQREQKPVSVAPLHRNTGPAAGDENDGLGLPGGGSPARGAAAHTRCRAGSADRAPRPSHVTMRTMSRRFALALAIGVTLIAVAVAATGCQPVLKPTNATRRVSFSERQTLFLGDRQRALRQTYFVFSTDGKTRISFDARTGVLHFTSSGRAPIGQGLAVVLERDGYLLTAGHILDKTNYVFGWFDGTLQLRPLRVVYARRTSSHADVAVTKVDGPLEAPPARGDLPVSGGAAFAVAAFRQGDQLGGTLDLTSGTVLGTSPDPSGSGTLLVDHDLPLWQGDSGGPLFSATGSLIGITSGYELRWRGLGWTYRKLSFLPDWKQIQALIDTDRRRIDGGEVGGHRSAIR